MDETNIVALNFCWSSEFFNLLELELEIGSFLGRVYNYFPRQWSIQKNSFDINWALQPIIEDVKLKLKSFFEFWFSFITSECKLSLLTILSWATSISQWADSVRLMAFRTTKKKKKKAQTHGMTKLINLTCWKLAGQVVFFIDAYVRKQQIWGRYIPLAKVIFKVCHGQVVFFIAVYVRKQ